MACLDTSIIISLLAGNKAISNLVSSYQEKEGVSSTSITEYELLRHQNLIKVSIAAKLMNSFPVHNFDRKAAQKAAEIYSLLQKHGTMINENDILIAATALSNGETLLTKDAKFKYLNSNQILVFDSEGKLLSNKV